MIINIIICVIHKKKEKNLCVIFDLNRLSTKIKRKDEINVIKEREAFLTSQKIVLYLSYSCKGSVDEYESTFSRSKTQIMTQYDRKHNIIRRDSLSEGSIVCVQNILSVIRGIKIKAIFYYRSLKLRANGDSSSLRC